MEKFFFEGCHCLNEAKHRYLATAKTYHPITGKDPIMLYFCRLEYQTFCREPFFRFDQLPVGIQDEYLRYPDIVDKLLGWGLSVELFATWTWVNGNTDPYSEQLKSMGFINDDSMQSWYLSPLGCCAANRNPLSDELMEELHLQRTIEALLRVKCPGNKPV